MIDQLSVFAEYVTEIVLCEKQPYYYVLGRSDEVRSAKCEGHGTFVLFFEGCSYYSDTDSHRFCLRWKSGMRSPPRLRVVRGCSHCGRSLGFFPICSDKLFNIMIRCWQKERLYKKSLHLSCTPRETTLMSVEGAGQVGYLNYLAKLQVGALSLWFRRV